MSRSGPWLIAAVLVVVALSAVWLNREPTPGPSNSTPPVSAAEIPRSDTGVASDSEGDSLETAFTQVPGLERSPDGADVSALRDSSDAQKYLIGRDIRNAGYRCPDVRSALSLNPEGTAWRAHCGESLLYWVESDEFGRLSVEPGVYDDGSGIDAGSRTITIQQEELQEQR